MASARSTENSTSSLSAWLRVLVGGLLVLAGYGLHAALPGPAAPPAPEQPAQAAGDAVLAARLAGLSGRLDDHGRTLNELLNHLASLRPPRVAENEAVFTDQDIAPDRGPEVLRAVFGGFLTEAYGKKPSKYRLLNECARSSDEFLVAFAFASHYDSAEFMNIYRMASRTAIDARAAVAARRLGEFMTPEVRDELIEEYDSVPHPRNWGIALALAEAGDPTYLEEWGAIGLQSFENSAPTRKDKQALGRIVHAALLAENPEAEGIARAALTSSHVDQAVRRRAIQLLANVGTPSAIEHLKEIGQSDDELAAVARIALRESMLPSDDETEE